MVVGMMAGHIAQQQHIPQQQQQQQQQQALNPSNNIGSNYMQQQGAGATSQQPVGTPPPPQQPAPPTQVPTTAAPLHCIRNGCQNPAITNSEWEDEYCSNECVVSHCRDVFTSWVASNQNAQNAHIEKNFSSVT